MGHRPKLGSYGVVLLGHFFGVQKSDFCHKTPILVNDPFLALGMTVNFPPWERFFDFPFRSYSCLDNDEEPGGGVVLLVLGSRDVEYVLGTEMSETQNRTNCIHLSYIFRASTNLEVTKNMKLSPFQ